MKRLTKRQRARKRGRHAQMLAERAFNRCGISQYHASKQLIVNVIAEALERRLKREDELEQQVRAYANLVENLR